MAATINSRPAGSPQASTLGENAKPNLLYKIDGHVARVNGIYLLSKEEAIWTISDDRSVRLYMKRDNDQFWPSIHHFMPVPPTAVSFNEETDRLLVGLLNGTVVDFQVADDCNSMEEKRKWQLHAGPVTSVFLSLAQELVFSCAKDKQVFWHCSETAVKMGSFVVEHSCTCMVVDLPFVFIGDQGGNVSVLRLTGSAPQLISKLSAHTGSITSLAWDASKQQLFSGSADNLVIMWDIGGKRGQAYELNSHKVRVNGVAVASAARRLFSVDDSGRLVCWDMDAPRMETPAWQTSDTCQECNAPFFWNVTAMWQMKVVGLRQHHCRTCGHAVCNTCCSHRTTFPPMGFELPVRICKSCQTKMEDDPSKFDLTPLAVSHEVRTGVTAIHLQQMHGRLATAGQNRVVYIWDVRNLF